MFVSKPCAVCVCVSDTCNKRLALNILTIVCTYLHAIAQYNFDPDHPKNRWKMLQIHVGTKCAACVSRSPIDLSSLYWDMQLLSYFTQPLYQSRCSCLIGVADAYRNFAGKFPQFLTMSGACYACKILEPNYFMVSEWTRLTNWGLLLQLFPSHSSSFYWGGSMNQENVSSIVCNSSMTYSTSTTTLPELLWQWGIRVKFGRVKKWTRPICMSVLFLHAQYCWNSTSYKYYLRVYNTKSPTSDTSWDLARELSRGPLAPVNLPLNEF